MKKVLKFELRDIGINDDDYAVARNGFDHVVMGVGDTKVEAFEDCLDRLARLGVEASPEVKVEGETLGASTPCSELYGSEVGGDHPLALALGYYVALLFTTE